MAWPTAETKEAAVRLLISSIFLANTYLDKYSAQIGDCITRCLHKILPLSLQEAFRDSGCIRLCGNLGAFVAACTYCSTNLQALLDMMHITRHITYLQYGATDQHRIEIFTPLDNTHSNYATTTSTAAKFGKPATLVFVHGGAWGCGRTWQYRLVANGIGRLLGVQNIVLIGYPTFPTSTILQQRDCISNALHYIHERAVVQKLLGTTAQQEEHMTILCGHSSGANICALALLDSLQASPQVITNTITDGGTTADTSFHVDLFIGLAGVYDINKHYLFEANRGVHIISPMTAAAGGMSGFNACSPTYVAKQLCHNRVPNAGRGARLKNLPYTVLIHGSEDLVVPASSSEAYLQAIEELESTKHKMITMQVCEFAVCSVLGNRCAGLLAIYSLLHTQYKRVVLYLFSIAYFFI